MSDYGLLTEVREIPKGSSLTTAAAISDTELVVDYAGDFNSDPDDPTNSGGTLDLNGARLAYIDVVDGDAPTDPDTILLADPLTVAADIDDTVAPVVGGQIATDYVAYVTMGEGDQVVVPLSVDQRSQWPTGVYADPIPVQISDDLLHIEDAPGRTSAPRTQFRNTDVFTVSGSGPQTFYLTYVPDDGSLHVHWVPLFVPEENWSLVGNVLTVEDPGWLVDDRIECEYAYDQVGGAIADPEPPPPPPPAGPLVGFEASGWKHYQTYAGDLAMYYSPTYDDSAWATDAAPFGHTVPDHTMSNFHGVAWPDYATVWTQGTRLWARRPVTTAAGVAVSLSLRWNRIIAVWWNGVNVYNASTSSAGEATVSIPAASVTGTDHLAIRITDDPYLGTGTGCYFDAEVEQ